MRPTNPASPAPQTIFNSFATFSGNEVNTALSTQEIETLKKNSPIKVFFNKADLLAILVQPDCIGIRLYPALTDSRADTITAIGIRVDRTEINFISSKLDDLDDKSESVIDGLIMRSEGSNPSTPLNQKNFKVDNGRIGERAAENPDESPFLRRISSKFKLIFAVYFSKKEMEETLLKDDAIGVRFYLDHISVPVDHPETDVWHYDTYTAVSVGQNMHDAPDLSGGYLTSAAPCPPHCGGQDAYNPAHRW